MKTRYGRRPALAVATTMTVLIATMAGGPSTAAAGVLTALDWEPSAQQTVPAQPPPGWAAEYRRDLVHPDTGEPQVRIARAPEPVRGGTASARFELHRTDPVINNGTRAELTAPFEPKNAERWYGFSIYLPASWVPDRSAEIVTQWHQHWDLGGSPPLALVTRGGNWEISQHWEGHGRQSVAGRYETDRWTDWVFHVRWSTGADGLVQVWKDGRPVAGFENRIGRNTYDSSYGNYMKIGIYKWDWSQKKPSDTSRRVMYHDELRVADGSGDYATVAPGAAGHICPAQTAAPVSAATASTWEPVNPPAQAVDSDLGTRWSGQGYGAHLQLDLGTVRSLCAVKIAWHRGNLRWNDFTVYTSVDGSAYIKAWEGRSSGSTAAFETYSFAAPRDGRYVRIAFWQNPENTWASISETLIMAASSTPAVTLTGAGDIASCTSPGDEATARLLDSVPGTVFTTGDNAYPAGSARDFGDCYDPSWGRHRARTRPSPGNHDYQTAGAAGYFDYFGADAGQRGAGYYSYDHGDWHVVSLNSNCTAVGGCQAGSAQERWLRADLAANARRCTLAYWHHPLFTSGAGHGPAPALRPLFQTLYDHGADVVVTGHNHQYERFAPQDPNGRLDATRGIRQFVAGMGGASHYGFGAIQPNSEARNGDTYGVLSFTLRDGGYDWRFIPEAGRTYTDGGSDTCH